MRLRPSHGKANTVFRLEKEEFSDWKKSLGVLGIRAYPDDMTSAPGSDSQRLAFGWRIRHLRAEKGWTLSELSTRSGLAISTLSKAERGIIALTYDRLSLLANGLDVDMSAFFTDTGTRFERGSFAVARKGEFERQETPNYVYEMLFSDVWNKSMRPMMGTLKAHELHQFEDFVRHPGQEFLIRPVSQ